MAKRVWLAPFALALTFGSCASSPAPSWVRAAIWGLGAAYLLIVSFTVDEKGRLL